MDGLKSHGYVEINGHQGGRTVTQSQAVYILMTSIHAGEAARPRAAARGVLQSGAALRHGARRGPSCSEPDRGRQLERPKPRFSFDGGAAKHSAQKRARRRQGAGARAPPFLRVRRGQSRRSPKRALLMLPKSRRPSACYLGPFLTFPKSFVHARSLRRLATTPAPFRPHHDSRTLHAAPPSGRASEFVSGPAGDAAKHNTLRGLIHFSVTSQTRPSPRPEAPH